MPDVMTSPVQMPAFDYTPRPYTGPSREEVLAARQRYANPALFTLYRDPLMIVEGRMQYLFDETGRRYLDLFAGIVTVSCGHCHPTVVARMREQMETLQHTTTIYLHPNMPRLAEKLAAKMPPGLDVTYFVNSGSEANDLAITMARLYTGHTDVIALRNAYHGGSPSAMGADLAPHLEVPHAAGRLRPSRPLPRALPEPARRDARGDRVRERGRHRGADPVLHTGPDRGFIAEPIQGVGGVTTAAPNYFREAYTDRAGVRRALHRRRGADRVRPHRRALLGFRELRGRPRHRHHGEGLRQRGAARRRHHPPGDRRGAGPAAPLQHLRRQPGVDGGRPGGAWT